MKSRHILAQRMTNDRSCADLYFTPIHAISEHRIRSPFIFCTTTGTMLDQRNLLRALHMMCENAGIQKRGLHSLRKLYINHTLRQGITPFDLAKVTGHTMQTMFKYYHDLDEELLSKIANASETRK